MEGLFLVVFLVVFPLSNILGFLIGARVGQKVVKGEEVELPKIDPMEAVRERREKKEAELKQNEFDKILRNVDRYDGTANGQEDVR